MPGLIISPTNVALTSAVAPLFGAKGPHRARGTASDIHS